MKTKEKILLAASEEFAEKGYQDTTTRSICGKINMNIAAANYHFHTKQELYQQVLRYLLGNKNDRGKNTANLYIHFESIEDWKHKIRKWILDFLLSMTSTSLPRQRWKTILIAREMAFPSEIFPWLCEYYFNPFISELQDFFEYVFPKKNNEAILLDVFSLVSQCLFYVQNRSIVEHALDKQIYTEKKLSEIAEHIYKDILAKVEND